MSKIQEMSSFASVVEAGSFVSGMSDKVGMVQLVQRQNSHLGGAGFGAAKPFSEDTARIIDSEVVRIINESHEQAKTLLGKHRKQLDALVSALLERETLGEQEILEATGLPPAPLLESGRVAAASSRDAPRASMRS